MPREKDTSHDREATIVVHNHWKGYKAFWGKKNFPFYSEKNCLQIKIKWPIFPGVGIPTTDGNFIAENITKQMFAVCVEA